MSPKKPPTKKNNKGRGATAVLEAVPVRKPTKAPSPAPVIKASTSKLELAPRSTEFTPVSRSTASASIAADGVEGRYVYGIIQSSQPKTFGKTAIGSAGEAVYTVHHGDVAA